MNKIKNMIQTVKLDVEDNENADFSKIKQNDND